MTSAPLRPYCFSSSGSSLAVSMPSKAAVMPKARMFFGSVVPSALLSSFQDRATVRTFGFLPSSQAVSVTKMLRLSVQAHPPLVCPVHRDQQIAAAGDRSYRMVGDTQLIAGVAALDPGRKLTVTIHVIAREHKAAAKISPRLSKPSPCWPPASTIILVFHTISLLIKRFFSTGIYPGEV